MNECSPTVSRAIFLRRILRRVVIFPLGDGDESGNHCRFCPRPQEEMMGI